MRRERYAEVGSGDEDDEAPTGAAAAAAVRREGDAPGGSLKDSPSDGKVDDDLADVSAPATSTGMVAVSIGGARSAFRAPGTGSRDDDLSLLSSSRRGDGDGGAHAGTAAGAAAAQLDVEAAQSGSARAEGGEPRRYQRLCIVLVAVGALALLIVILAVPRRPRHTPADRPEPDTSSAGDTPDNDGNQGPPHEVPEGHKAVLLVSMDGFRWDYLDGRAKTPNFDRFTSHGVRASMMRPVFPSKTFPNHYSIVTGLYPESHGIIGNRMYDPVFDEIYTISGPQAVDGKWYGGEPLWVTAEKQGMKSACMFWPGSEAEIKGVRPSYYRHYDGSVPFSSRVDQVMDWLLLPPEDRPQLLTMYLSSPDHEGHMYGPGSSQVIDAVERVDSTLGYLLDSIEEKNMWDYLNVIVTADHGMAEVRPSRVIYLEDYIDITDVTFVTWSPVLGLIPAPGVSAAAIVANLTGVHPQMQVWLKEDVPERFHYQANRRIPPIVGLAANEWTIEASRSRHSWYGNGAHGFDNELDDMHAIFTASGPLFKQQYFAGKVKNIDIYPLVCDMLGLQPAPNNGSLSAMAHVLREMPASSHPQP